MDTCSLLLLLWGGCSFGEVSCVSGLEKGPSLVLMFADGLVMGLVQDRLVASCCSVMILSFSGRMIL